jgi:hypothetical protein
MEGIMGETASFYAPSKTNIEQLQVILAERSGTDVTLEEAEEVGIQLVSLYECLARERNSAEEDGDGHTA